MEDGYVALMKGHEKCEENFAGNPDRKRKFDSGIDKMIILKWILKKCGVGYRFD
jgi:hypothetical protein